MSGNLRQLSQAKIFPEISSEICESLRQRKYKVFLGQNVIFPPYIYKPHVYGRNMKIIQANTVQKSKNLLIKISKFVLMILTKFADLIRIIYLKNHFLRHRKIKDILWLLCARAVSNNNTWLF